MQYRKLLEFLSTLPDHRLDEVVKLETGEEVYGVGLSKTTGEVAIIKNEDISDTL